MSSTKSICLLLALFFVLLAGTKSASACSCILTPDVTESFNQAENVIIARNVSLEKPPAEEASNFPPHNGFARMTIEKVFKGNLKAGAEIVFLQGRYRGSDCVWGFSEESVGRRFLFYLYKSEPGQKYWVADICSRSSSVERAADDLLYLNKLDKVRGKTRLSGTLNFEPYQGVTIPERAGRKIRVMGNDKNYDLKTDKNGVFEIYDLPPGNYRVALPEKVNGWKADELSWSYMRNRNDNEIGDKPPIEYPVRLEAGKHAVLDFRFEIDNALRGKVFDPNGKAMKGVCLKLIPPDVAARNFFYLTDCTNESGKFTIEEVPPGSYIMVTNESGKITAGEPFETLYYPGVTERDKADVITIGFAESRSDLNFLIPRVYEVVTIEGVFLYSEGDPVAGEYVYFESDKKVKGDFPLMVKTDAAGRFSFRVLRGTSGKLSGSMRTYLGKFVDCPKLDALIKEKGINGSYSPETDEVSIDGQSDVQNIELKLPFPSCKSK